MTIFNFFIEIYSESIKLHVYEITGPHLFGFGLWRGVQTCATPCIDMPGTHSQRFLETVQLKAL